MDKEKIKQLKKQIEALIIAIPRELAAYEFYMDLAENSDAPHPREMFVFLGNQEKMHKDKLEELLKQFQENLEKEIKGAN